MVNDDGLSELKKAVQDLLSCLDGAVARTMMREDNKMSQSRVAGSRSEFVAAWNEWAREINRLAYQSDDERTIMDAIKLRDDTLALIDNIADEIYPISDLPAKLAIGKLMEILEGGDDDPAAD
jgi:hypothetical protein